MKTKYFLLVAVAFVMAHPLASKRKDKRSIVRLETSMGNIRIALLDETPLHRDNFIALVDSGFYDGKAFHRVIRDFMVQTGEDSLVDYTLPAEFQLPYYYHLRGAVAAAREGDDVNPEQRSSGTQFYIVWGRSWGPQSIRKQRDFLAEKGIEMTAEMRNDYEQYGGTPHLDGQYTVFGQVVEGMKVVDRLQQVPTDSLDCPLQPVCILRAVVEQRSRAAQSK